jgi:predicted RNase H-like HicB family nuclease
VGRCGGHDVFGIEPHKLVEVNGGVVTELKRSGHSTLVPNRLLGLNEVMSANASHHVELTAVLWVAPEGGFHALNPETGTVSQGDTEAEALANLTEATELFLEEFPLSDCQKPVITTIRVADVA